MVEEALTWQQQLAGVSSWLRLMWQPEQHCTARIQQLELKPFLI